MVKNYESRFPPSPNLDKVIVSFDKLINTFVGDSRYMNIAFYQYQAF